MTNLKQEPKYTARKNVAYVLQFARRSARPENPVYLSVEITDESGKQANIRFGFQAEDLAQFGDEVLNG